MTTIPHIHAIIEPLQDLSTVTVYRHRITQSTDCILSIGPVSKIVPAGFNAEYCALFPGTKGELYYSLS